MYWIWWCLPKTAFHTEICLPSFLQAGASTQSKLSGWKPAVTRSYVYALAWPQGQINRPKERQYLLMSANIVPNICTGHLVSLVCRQNEITYTKYQNRGIHRWQKLWSRGCASKPRAVACNCFVSSPCPWWVEWHWWLLQRYAAAIWCYLSDFVCLATFLRFQTLCSPDYILQSKMMLYCPWQP